MRSFWVGVSVVGIQLVLVAAFITYACQDDWCYIFPWQNSAQTMVSPGENVLPYETTLEGKYTCLPHKNATGPQTLECALGIKLANGLYYALDMGDLLNSPAVMKTSAGTKIRVKGTLVPIETISSNQWQQYNVRGIIRVETFKAL